MIFSRAWLALMIRNFIYRRRHWVGSLIELLAPICFVGILISIKNSLEDDLVNGGYVDVFYPTERLTVTPMTFTDYVTALQAKRVCFEEVVGANNRTEFVVSGRLHKGFNWQVPFVKCDSMACEYDGQDAQPFCEYGIIAVSGSTSMDLGGYSRAWDFKTWVEERYPVLPNAQRLANETWESRVPFEFEFIQVFQSPSAMDEYVKDPEYGKSGIPKINFGVVFDGNDKNNFKYWLRQNTTNFNAPEEAFRPSMITSPDTAQLFSSYAQTDRKVCEPLPGTPTQGPLQSSCTGQYLYNGVLTMQRLVGDYVHEVTGAKDAGYFVAEAGVQYVQFPNRPHQATGFYGDIEDSGPLLVSLGMLYPVAAMIGCVTLEKELRQKELMKMMSVMESDIEWAWFFSFFLFNALSATCTSIVSTSLYVNSAFIFLWIYWMLTFLAITAFSLLCATFTSKASRGILVGLLVFFVGVFATLALDFKTTDKQLLYMLSLHPVAAFCYGLFEIGRLEDEGIGLDPVSINHTDNPSGYVFLDTVRTLLIDTVLCGMLTWYMNRVVAPDYGQALPLWFPFSTSYWCPKEITSAPADMDDVDFADPNVPIEPVGESLKRQKIDGESIEIRRLRKVFGDNVAVDDLTLSMYNGEITALLGHNGAGKTTTINMLIGAIAPSGGYASVAGKDIRTQIQQVRQDMGICLQHDCLFPQLTVREHLQFFARVKGLYSTMSTEQAEAQIDQSIQDVALAEKRNTLSCNLSGGMKRKLSVAIAFCSGSKVVLLDEPTSGMDPFSRRFTWNVIRQYRKNRCIILTTHFMDEADILGDRIAIMAQGRLQCAGSSLFLKKTYGVGYQLTIDKRSSLCGKSDWKNNQQDDNSRPTTRKATEVTQIVGDSLSESSLETEVVIAGTELVRIEGRMLSDPPGYKVKDIYRKDYAKEYDSSLDDPSFEALFDPEPPRFAREGTGDREWFDIERPQPNQEEMVHPEPPMSLVRVDQREATSPDPVALIQLVHKWMKSAATNEKLKHDFRNGIISERPDGILQSIYEKERYTIHSGQDISGPNLARSILGLTGHDAHLHDIVTDYVPDATVLSNVGSEMIYQLPFEASSKFARMFQGLDREVQEGRISSYGVGITTLEEVFVLVAKGLTATQRKEPEYASSTFVRARTYTDQSARSYKSRMDLEKDGLFVRHLGALLKKRAANFKRDRKAWLFTTILPSLFALIGFCIFKFFSPSRELDPLVLDFKEYNPEVLESPRNPIVFNSPANTFQCQPGVCAYYSEPILNETRTGELYTFCGYQARMMETNRTCTISESYRVVSRITEAGAMPQEAFVRNVSESSQSLYESSDVYAASQYGAILFTHDQASTMDNGISYNSYVTKQCEKVHENLTYSRLEDCERFAGMGYIVQYNFTALHVSPLYQTLADEAIVRHALDKPDFNIECTIAPLPMTRVEMLFGEAENAFAAWFLVILSFPFIPGAFATFIVAERESKAKHLQTVAGVNPLAYWASSWLWDILNYQIPLWICVALMFLFDVSVLTTTANDVVYGVLALLVLYGPASAGFTYCVSFAFSSPSYCNMCVILFGFLTGMGGAITNFVLILLANDPLQPRPSMQNVADTLAWCLRPFPSFCLGKGLFNAINIQAFLYLERDPSLSAFSGPVLLYEFFALLPQSVGYLLLAVQLDKCAANPRAMSIFRNVIRTITFNQVYGRKTTSNENTTVVCPDDDDVLAEQVRVQEGRSSKDLITLKGLTKVYDNGKVAVNNLSIGIPPGECFGLLGINGAGKTTTMQILTAEFPPTRGDAILAGFSLLNEPEKTRRRIGYCPQFDANFANMTGREHVELYAEIKGIPRMYVTDAVEEKLNEVGLSGLDGDRLSSGYSGGMRRRLSLACATIGQPQIVFLDECSTGVDPVARRDIWQLVSDMVSGGDIPDKERTSVILTTHSMEECEALCPRIGIMANGRLRCLGSAQQLKNKFGQGYQVELTLRIVFKEDPDFIENVAILKEAKDLKESNEPNPSYNLEETDRALRRLSSDDYLRRMVNPNNTNGYNIWKDASSDQGVTLDMLGFFVTSELRMRRLSDFMNAEYPGNILRERQELKTRYEVSSKNVSVSSIFASIEGNKERLYISEYGVSQTSLEQVFNLHAAEAEQAKQGQNDK